MNFYWNTEQKYSKITVISFMSCVQFTYHAALWWSFYCILAGNMGPSTWLMPFVLAMPFRTDTLSGWYMMWFFTSSMDFCYISCMSSITLYFVSTCFYIEAMCEHFKFLLHSIELDVMRSQQDVNAHNDRKIVVQINSLVRRVVELHVQIYELV